MKYRRLPCPVCARPVCHVRRHLATHPGAVPVAFPADEDPTGDRYLEFVATIVEREKNRAVDGRTSDKTKIETRLFLMSEGLAWILAGLGIDIEAFYASLVRQWIGGTNGK